MNPTNEQELRDRLFELWRDGRSDNDRYNSVHAAEEWLLDWHNKQVKSEPNECEFGHQLYGHKTAEGWCCACEADQAFMNGNTKQAVEELLDRLEKEMNRYTAEHDVPMRDEAIDAIEAERAKLKEVK